MYKKYKNTQNNQSISNSNSNSNSTNETFGRAVRLVVPYECRTVAVPPVEPVKPAKPEPQLYPSLGVEKIPGPRASLL